MIINRAARCEYPSLHCFSVTSAGLNVDQTEDVVQDVVAAILRDELEELGVGHRALLLINLIQHMVR